MERFITQAGNTVVPAVLAIKSLGFTVTLVGEDLRAQRGEDSYVADDPVALLGLIRLVELRSWTWHASDQDITEILRRFGWE